jgi:hypothetical protein
MARSVVRLSDPTALWLALSLAALTGQTATAVEPDRPTADGVVTPARQVSAAEGFTVPEDAPDQNPRADRARSLAIGPNGKSVPLLPPNQFQYLKTIGTAFQPRESTSTYAYTTNGCMYQNGGSTFRFQGRLDLPDGAIIKFLRIYYLDTAATDMTAWITRYDPGQGNLDLTSVMSTGSGGYGTTLSPLIDQVVDNATYAYVLTWGTSVATSANQICGVRVAYYPPADGTFNPITPCRVADTRGNGFTGAYGPPFMPGSSSRNFVITGQCGIPAAATAVSFNFTVTDTAGPGFLLAYPQGGSAPTVSTLNYLANQIIANAAVVPLSASGAITVVPGVSGFNLIIDVNGYYY